MGRRYYVVNKAAPTPTKFVTSQQLKGRTFIDQDGTEYVIVWPIGNLPLSELRDFLQEHHAEIEQSW